MVDGLDIATYQRGIPVERLKPEGIGFVIHKMGGANGGSLYVDSGYRSVVPRIRQQGIKIGHYFFNGSVDPVASANFFVDNLSGYQPGEPLALDIEGEDLQGVGWAHAWFSQVIRRVSSPSLLLYTTQGYVRQWDWSPVVALGVKLWIAAPGDDNPYVGEFGEWAIHQYTWTASIAGFGPLDGNHSKDYVWNQDDGYDAAQRKELIGDRIDGTIVPDLRTIKASQTAQAKQLDAALEQLKNVVRREARYRLYRRTSNGGICAVNWPSGHVIRYDSYGELEWDVKMQIIALIIDGSGARPEPPIECSDKDFDKVLASAAKIYGD